METSLKEDVSFYKEAGVNSINSKILREFLYVCATGSITAAANGLFISPQGLSKSIKKLEDDLGVELFRRDPSGMHLTSEGKVLREKAVHIIAELDSIQGEALKEAAALEKNIRKTVRMELTFGSIKFFTLHDMHRFEELHPDIKISMNEGTDHEITSHIRNGERDIGFCVGPIDTSSFDAVYVYSRKHCLVVNKENRLSRKKSVTWADLKGEPVIFESKEFSAYNNNLNRCLKAGFEPQIVFCAGDVRYAHQLAEENVGIAISVEDMIQEEMLKNSVKIPFSEPDCTMDIYMITQKNKSGREEVEALVEYVRNWIKTDR